MNHPFEFESEELIEAAASKDWAILASLYQELTRLDHEARLAFEHGDLAKALRLEHNSQELLGRILTSEGGPEFLRDMSKMSRTAEDLPGDFDASSEKGKDAGFDTLIGETIEDMWSKSPDAVLDLALASLKRSAVMMEEIVEETRRDLIEFEIRRNEIDRKQTETRAILNEALERMR